MKRFWLALGILSGVAAATVPAAAAPDVTYQLTCNANPCTTSTNYGQVTLHEVDANNVLVTVDLTTASATETFAGSGAGFTIAWNWTGSGSAPAESVSGIAVSPTGDNTNFVFQLPSPGAYKASPFTGGSCKKAGDCFMYAIDTTINGQNTSDNKLVFDVNSSSGLTINNFLKGTTDGFIFAVDIFRAGATFNVAAKIPEPATWLMLLTGLAGLTFLAQRRRKKAFAL